MKKFLVCLLVLSVCILCGCGGGESSNSSTPTVTEISLNGSSAEVKGGGAKAEGNIITISAVGNYSVSGTLDDGQIIIDTGDEAMEVTLTLNNASITNLSGPAIYVKQAKDLNLELAAGSDNTVVSGKEAALGEYDEAASGAAIYAEDDMDIDGSADAKLSVFGYINNGIACKNDLDIQGGSISVYAVNNGVRGNDSFEMKGGELSVLAGNDGVKSTTLDKEGKGYVSVEGGSIAVEAVGDGISAETDLRISGGTISVVTSGNPAEVSSKGIKANNSLEVSGGEISVEAEDHALQCNGAVSVKGGALALLSYNGKGVASDADITVDGGKVSINSIEDGIETLGNIYVNAGEISIVSAKDGLQAGEANSGKGDVLIKGGNVYVNAYKLGINARGKLQAAGGNLLALCGEDKQLNNCEGCTQLMFSGAKGNVVSVSAGGAVAAELESAWSYKGVLFSFGAKSGETYTVSNGSVSQEVVS